ncbi:hypothetical protein KAU18_01415 [Candidatus Bathyarchaeota archaeon]|nr:hypothetical protein [Candidatus Bathyarchaeota archaeon]
MTEIGLLLTNEDRALLLRVGELLEGIIETLEILEDEKAVASLREAEEDVRVGRVRDYRRLIEELRRSGEV